jgi:inosine/xanthosine triphosphatase
MRIAIGSANMPKLNAVKQAVSSVYPELKHEFVSHAEDSGVEDHPTTAERGRLGALNRATRSRARFDHADFWIGIEGAMNRESVPRYVDSRLTWVEQWFELGLVVVIDKHGHVQDGQSSGLTIPSFYAKDIVAGSDLNLVIEHHHGIERIGDHGGATQLLTGGALNRVSSYVPGIIQALAPFKHSKYY